MKMWKKFLFGFIESLRNYFYFVVEIYVHTHSQKVTILNKKKIHQIKIIVYVFSY